MRWPRLPAQLLWLRAANKGPTSLRNVSITFFDENGVRITSAGYVPLCSSRPVALNSR